MDFPEPEVIKKVLSTADDSKPSDNTSENMQQLSSKSGASRHVLTASKYIEKQKRSLKGPLKWLSAKQAHILVMNFVFLGTIFILMWDLVVTTPHYYKWFDISAWRHLALQIFFLHNVIGNALYTMYADYARHGNALVMSTENQPGWRYCDKCRHYLPPRSHHCRTCNFCVLKRDHHCVITGTCISFQSHRFFLMMLFHYVIAGTYEFFYQLEYFWLYTGNDFFSCAFNIFMPHVALLFGQITLYAFVVIAFQLIGLTIIGGAAYALAIQLCAVLHGQTSYEMDRGITTYDCGYMQNIRNTVGTRWYLVWISPAISSPLPGEYGDFRANHENNTSEAIKKI